MRQKLKPSLCLSPDETITGFNYAFTSALLRKLKELNLSNRLYQESSEKNGVGPITDTAASVISYLSQQVNFRLTKLDGVPGGAQIKHSDLCDLIAHAEEFLAIFEEE